MSTGAKPASVWDTRKKPVPDRARPAAAPRPAAPRQSAPVESPRIDSGDARREVKYYGVAACMALWERRSLDIVRISIVEPLIPKFNQLLRWAAAKRKAYHVVTNEDLERITESIHHQGICILARERSPLEFSDLLGLLNEDQGKQLMVYLDGVENPHNLGAIVRTCAHFGVKFILGAEGRLPKLSGSACRVAEGGAEQVAMVTLRSPTRQLQQLRDLGFQFIATAVGEGASLYQHPFAARTLLIMGAEHSGVSKTLYDMTEQVLKIPGSGSVESLNVSVAFGVCAGEFYRQQLTPSRQAAKPARPRRPKPR